MKKIVVLSLLFAFILIDVNNTFGSSIQVITDPEVTYSSLESFVIWPLSEITSDATLNPLIEKNVLITVKDSLINKGYKNLLDKMSLKDLSVNKN